MSAESDEWDAEGVELPPRNLRIVSRRDCHQSGWQAFAQDPDDRYTSSRREDNRRRVGYVSIWIGSVPDERTLEFYLRERNDSFNLEEGEEEFCPLWDELGFPVYREQTKTRFSGKSIAIEELVSSFPGIEVFRDSLLTACRSLGINEGNAVIAVYGLDDSDHQSLLFDRLRYAGSFLYAAAVEDR